MVSRAPTWAKKVPKDRRRDGFKRANLGKEGPNLGKEGPKDRLEMDRLEMVSREPTWAKKVPRIDERWFQESQLGQRRSQR